MPVYKAECYLHRGVDSILHQSLADFELLLVDDGSPDSSGIICDQYASIDSRVRVIHQSNKGVSAAREVGMGHARGEYIIHADPDDWVDSSMLYDLYTEAKKQDADMVICDFYDEYPWGTLYQTQSPNELTSESVLRGLFENLHGSCCNKLVKRDSWEKARIHFPEGMNFCEDLYVNVSLLLNPLKIAYINKAYYHYDHIINSSSITRTGVDVDKLIMRIDRITPLIINQFPDLVERMKFTAKKACLCKYNSYSDFNKVYPILNWTPMKGETSYYSIRFASFSRISYYLTQLWIMAKDIVFIFRKL